MNNLGTIVHDFNTPYLDSHFRNSEKQHQKKKERGDKYDDPRKEKMFKVNPLWRKAFSGR